MAEVYELICIGCPLGCRLTVTKNDDESWLVKGNQCNNGKDYGIKEMTNPTRVLTTTVKITGSYIKRLPVRTDKAIARKLIYDAMKLINRVEVKAPVRMGDIIIENILDTEVNVIASRTLKREL